MLIWSLSAESVCSLRELVANSVHTADADATVESRRRCALAIASSEMRIYQACYSHLQHTAIRATRTVRDDAVQHLRLVTRSCQLIMSWR